MPQFMRFRRWPRADRALPSRFSERTSSRRSIREARRRFRFHAVTLGTSHIELSRTDHAGLVQPSAYVLDVVVR
jgi:hypothetical protein